MSEVRDDVDTTIERIRRKHEAMLLEVPCGMSDESLCSDQIRAACAHREHALCPVRRIVTQREADLRLVRQAEEDARRTATAMGLPKRHWHLCAIPGGPPGPPTTDTTAMQSVTGSTDCILVLAGPPGTGKSGAAAVACWQRRGVFKRSVELARATWYRGSVVDALIAAPLLVIDDLGIEVDDDRGIWRSRLDELVASRYDDDRPTIITSNLLPDPLKKLLGERLVGRIRQVGRIVECVGENLRRKA